MTSTADHRRYALTDANGRRLLEFDRVGRFFTDEPPRDGAGEEAFVEFVCSGFRVPENAPIDVTRVDPGTEIAADGAMLFLDMTDDLIARYPLTEIDRTGTAADGSLWFNGFAAVLPPESSQNAWETWRRGGPTEIGLWRGLSREARNGWLHTVTQVAAVRPPPSRPRHEIPVVEGGAVEELDDVFLAVGEALGGPGGYRGHSLATLEDRLARERRENGRVRIHWLDVETTRARLGAPASDGTDDLTEFDLVMSVLRRTRVDVVFD